MNTMNQKRMTAQQVKALFTRMVNGTGKVIVKLEVQDDRGGDGEFVVVVTYAS